MKLLSTDRLIGEVLGGWRSAVEPDELEMSIRRSDRWLIGSRVYESEI